MGRDIGQIPTSEILADAVKHHKADPDATGDIPKEVEGEIAVDPKEVAAGKEVVADEPKLDKDGKPIVEDDFEPYVPDDPKAPDAPAKPEDKPADKPAEDKKVTPAKDSELEAFAEKLKKDGYEEDAINDLVAAAELGGKLALKRMEAARAEDEAKAKEIEEKQTEDFSRRRIAEFQAVGRLQKDGRIPKVPIEIQKKIVEGKSLTEDESKHAGVARQNEVWAYMAAENKKVAESGVGYFITGFAQALDLLEAKEIRSSGSDQAKRDADIRKAKAAKLAGGSNGGGGDGAKKPGYIRGQSLDEVAMEIQRDYRSGS